MTPEQREELKQAAQAANAGSWTAADYRAFNVLASPAAILSLIAQVEALTVPHEPFTYAVDGEVMSPLEYINYLHDQIGADNRKITELQRGYDERGAQIGRLEVALRRGTEAAQSPAPTDAWRYRARKYGGVWAATGNDVMIKRMLEIDPEFWEIEQLFAPTIPAIPGTKEGA